MRKAWRAWRRRDKSPPLQELTSRKWKRKGQKLTRILEMEKTCTAFLCVLLCWWRTSLELASYRARGEIWPETQCLHASLTGKSTLENKYHLCRVVQGHSAVYIHDQPSDTCVQVRLKGRMEGHTGRWMKSDVRQMFCCADRTDEISLPWQLPYILSDKNYI